MYAARTGPSHGLGNMDKKFGENRTYSSWDVIADRQTHTHTERDRQTDRATRSSQYYASLPRVE